MPDLGIGKGYGHEIGQRIVDRGMIRRDTYSSERKTFVVNIIDLLRGLCGCVVTTVISDFSGTTAPYDDGTAVDNRESVRVPSEVYQHILSVCKNSGAYRCPCNGSGVVATP